MKRLLSMLFHRSESTNRENDWWNLSVSEQGEPPEERQYMFVLPALISVIKSKLQKLRKPEE